MQRKKVYLVLFFLMAFGLCLQFLTLPMIKKTKTTKLNLEERRAYLTERKKIIETIEALQKEYKLREDQIKILDVALPTEDKIADILFQFQNMATDSGLVMKTFAQSEGVDAELPAAKTIIVSTDLLGSYSSLKAFLKKLEKNLRITDIKTIEFSIGAEKTEGGAKAESLFQTRFSTVFYYFPEEDVSK